VFLHSKEEGTTHDHCAGGAVHMFAAVCYSRGSLPHEVGQTNCITLTQVSPVAAGSVVCLHNSKPAL
jgi:hypothetical protein